MLPCLPVPKARRFWRACDALSAFGPVVRGTGARGQAQRGPKIGIGMVETTEKTSEKKLSVNPAKTLTLKARGVEQGVVRQSFSHGRTKAVVVEKVKSRVPTRAKGDAPASSA